MSKDLRDRVLIFDTTLRDGEQCPGASMTPSQKMEVARALAEMNVDIIEAGFPISSPGDFESVRQVAQEIRGPVIAGLARTRDIDIDRCLAALEPAERPRVHTFVATSDVHVQKKLRKTREEVIEIAVRAVERARKGVDDVEFSPEDAARTDLDYMCKIVEAVIDAGATTINIPDTVGYASPWEFGNRIRYVFDHVPNIGKAIISVHCHNDLGLAVANSLAGVRAGARQVECTINGIGERAGNASLEEVVMNLKTREDFFKLATDIRTEHIYRTSRLVSNMTGMAVQPNKAIVGANAFAHEAGIHQDGVIKERTTYEIMTPESVGWKGQSLVLGKHSGKGGFGERLKALGYDLDSQSLEKVTAQLKELADKKKVIYDQDLIAIVQQEGRAIEATYILDGLSVTSGTGTSPTATVRLRKGDEILEESMIGDGPVDAAYKAIAALTETKSNMTSFNIHAVTEGADALGEVTVTLAQDNHTAVGRGSHTDIILASVKAYLDALNRLEQRLSSSKVSNQQL